MAKQLNQLLFSESNLDNKMLYFFQKSVIFSKYLIQKESCANN